MLGKKEKPRIFTPAIYGKEQPSPPVVMVNAPAEWSILAFKIFLRKTVIHHNMSSLSGSQQGRSDSIFIESGDGGVANRHKSVCIVISGTAHCGFWPAATGVFVPTW